MLHKRVAELSLMNLDRIPKDRVGFGSTVHLRESDSQTVVYQLVLPEDADPDSYLNRATEAFVDVTVDKVGTRFPGFPDAAISSSYAGCYDVTPDWNPVISPGPLDGLVIAAGFSGHGFKIAPAVGQLVADLVIDGRSSDPRIPESDFRFSRFADGELLTTPYPYVGAGEMR